MVSLPGMAMVLRLGLVERHRLAGDELGAVLVAHAAPGGEQGVLVGEVGEGVDADGRDFQLAFEGPVVEGLDVLELVDELEVAVVELVVGQGVEHEGVVGVGAVPDPDGPADGGGHGGSGLGRRSIRGGSVAADRVRVGPSLPGIW